jgi:hypothetical protein
MIAVYRENHAKTLRSVENAALQIAGSWDTELPLRSKELKPNVELHEAVLAVARPDRKTALHPSPLVWRSTLFFCPILLSFVFFFTLSQGRDFC